MANEAALQDPAAPERGPNDEVIAFWRDMMVDKYHRYRDVLVGASTLHAMHALSLHPPRSGGRVLDVGCGFGETTIEIARRVGEHGQAVGLDPCQPFLDVARADARRARVGNASFRCGDAQTEPLGGFDRVFSAFGVMFFAQPVAALRNLCAAMTSTAGRGAAEPGGRIQLLVWNARAENPWLTLAVEACERLLPPRVEDAATCGPGPFSMSDPDTLGAMLAAAGLTRIQLHRFREDVFVGASVERAVDFQLTLGPAGERMRLSGARGTPLEAQVRDEARRLLAPHARRSGIWLPSSVWYATGVC